MTPAKPLRSSPLSVYVPRLALAWHDMEERHRRVQGTLTFVDISGFTRLSEQLARSGKSGAEEVTYVLNRIFTGLLEIADAGGGDLIKFGGDALLLFFTGESHAVRAAGSALAMQKRLKKIGRVETSRGVVRLRMSVGIHSGDFDFFLVGDSHKELLVTGPSATRTVEMESIAEAGEVLVSQACAEHLPARVLGDEKGEGILLKRVDLVTSSNPDPGIDLAEAAPFISKLVREHLIGSGSQSEHRAATVGFIHFSGVDGMLTSAGPERTSSALDNLVTAAQAACDEHGVGFISSDIAADGGKLILTAGIPVTFGQDDDSMLLACRQIVQDKNELELHVGINRGRVFSGDVGAAFRRSYTLLGDAVNLAARVMAKAGPGEILSTAPSLEGSSIEYSTQQLEPFLVKGKSEPVRAWLIGPPRGTKGVDRPTPFVGREDELQAILQAHRDALMGSGSTVAVVGPAGIGKSRLVAEAIDRIPDNEILTAHCGQYARTSPYFPFRTILGQILRLPQERSRAAEELSRFISINCPSLEGWLPLLGMVLDVETSPTPEVQALDPAFITAKLHETVEELLDQLLPAGAVLRFENVQWMDSASVGLFQHLSNRSREHLWLLMASGRSLPDGFEPPPSCPVISLGALQASSMDELAVLLSEQPLPPAERGRIVERSQGNPLFLKEMIRSVKSTEDLQTIPESVEALLAARLDQLPGRTRTLVRIASVVGTEFDAELLPAAAGEMSADPEMLGLSDAAEVLALDGGMVRFHHNLMREIAYEGLPYRTRQEIHRRLARFLERAADQPIELLSIHSAYASDHRRAWRYCTQAGDKTFESYAYLESSQHYGLALKAASKLQRVSNERHADIYRRLGDSYRRLGRIEEALASYRKGRRLAEKNSVIRARLFWDEGELRFRHGRYPQAVTAYRQGLKELGPVHSGARREMAALLEVGIAACRLRQGDFRSCIRIAESVIERLPGQGSRTRADAFQLLQIAYSAVGDERWKQAGESAMEIYEQIGHLIGVGGVSNNFGLAEYFAGDWQQAAQHYEVALRSLKAAGDMSAAAEAALNLGELKLDQGRLDEAHALLSESLDLATNTGNRLAGALAIAWLGRLAARRGDGRAANERFREALEALDGVESGPYRHEIMVRQAEAFALLGAEEGDTITARELGPTENPELPVTLQRVAGYHLLRQGCTDKAAETFKRALESAKEQRLLREIALNSQALESVLTLSNGDAEAYRKMKEEVFERLGVIAAPELPLEIVQ